MEQPAVSLTIVFADISGSTRLYELLGDVRAREQLQKMLQTVIGMPDGEDHARRQLARRWRSAQAASATTSHWLISVQATALALGGGGPKIAPT